MKDRRGSDRFAVFPFSMGCMSQSAVSVADPSSSSSAAAALTEQPAAAGSSEEGTGAAEAMKDRAGVSRLLKGLRSLSQIFVAYDAGEDEEEEREMVIGYPTDVQHVGHIGWDGHTNKVGADMVNGFSLPSSLSLRHLDMAMDHAAACDGSS